MLDIERAKGLCEKATPGPWFKNGNTIDIHGEAKIYCVSQEDGLPHVQDENDIEFISFARTFIPEAIARLEKLEVAAMNHGVASVRLDTFLKVEAEREHLQARVRELEAENERLREALEKLRDMQIVETLPIVEAALAKPEGGV